MSELRPRAGILRRAMVPFAVAAFAGVAALLMLALIPVVYQDPDATPGPSAVGSVVSAAINASIALVAVLGRRHRGVLIGVAVAAFLVGLVSLDGVAAFSTHTRAPWIELPILVGVIGADMLASVAAVVAAILMPRRSKETAAGSRASAV